MERDASSQERSTQRAIRANDAAADSAPPQPGDQERSSERSPVSGTRPSYPPPSRNDAPTDELLGRFAHGGMAEIYLARQVAADELERYLAVKCIRPAVADDESFLRMFKREARLALQPEVDGRTPLDLDDVAPGNHVVRLRRAGYADWEGPVEVPESGRAVLEQTLQARGIARVNINTRPWSRVYVGRRLLGTTPIADARVPAGRSRLRFVDRDGDEHRRWISVPRGDEESLFYDLRE